jgi:hypothetical protein
MAADHGQPEQGFSLNFVRGGVVRRLGGGSPQAVGMLALEGLSLGASARMTNLFHTSYVPLVIIFKQILIIVVVSVVVILMLL